MDSVIQVVSGWLFTPDQSRVLIVNNIGGVWTPPGGGVEMGEHLEPAMIREAYEETGLRVMPERLVAVSEGFNIVKQHKIVFFSFLLRQIDPLQQPEIVRPDEISEIMWATPSDVAARMPWLPFDPWVVTSERHVRIYHSEIK